MRHFGRPLLLDAFFNALIQEKIKNNLKNMLKMQWVCDFFIHKYIEAQMIAFIKEEKDYELDTND